MEDHRLVHAGPPLPAVERFLYSQKEDTLCKQKCSTNRFRPIVKTTQEIVIRNDSKENTTFSPRKEKHMAIKGATRDDQNSTKKQTYKKIIKGQWTTEEDRNLIRLVREHGERKWALISEKIKGRAGKQCRERWHNHLRPDIKKDVWNEEEERVLVEAHMKIGNKWAEIAKFIPGRTENSIKNHWNTTKRRKNSKRKQKLDSNGDSKDDDLSPSAKRPCVLQDYIKSIEHNDINKDKNKSENKTVISVLSTPKLDQIYSDGDSKSSIMDDPYDEDIAYLRNIFANHPIFLENIGFSANDTNQSSSSGFKNPSPNFHNKFDTHHQETTITSPSKTPHLISTYLIY